MVNVGPMELIIILIIALLVLGPRRLPEAGRSLGRGLREFKDSVTGKDQEELRAAEPADVEPEPIRTTASERKP